MLIVQLKEKQNKKRRRKYRQYYQPPLSLVLTGEFY